MTYQDCVTKLKTIEMAHYIPNHANSIRLMAYLNNPQNTLPVIHIAGTNGKGSTAQYLNHILRESAYKVGTFLSPHIFDYKELIHNHEGMISHEAFAMAAFEVFIACDQMVSDGFDHPTVFECLVGIAIIHFKNMKHDFLIFEVGMGGKDDATNIFDCPLMTVITPISFDHEEWLGHTLSEIATHKAGIIKAGSPVILGPNPIEVISVVSEHVKKVDTYLYLLDEGLIHCKTLVNRPNHKLFNLSTPFFNYTGLLTTMLGRHQEINLAVALLAVHQLQKNYEISDNAIRAGVKATHWTCRNELLCLDPLVLIDGGHNPAGIKAVADIINTYYADYQVITILGVLKDKSFEEMLNLTKSFSQQVILTNPISDRCLNLNDITTELSSNIQKIDNYEDALTAGLQQLSTKSLLVVTGSLYLAYPAKLWLSQHLEL